MFKIKKILFGFLIGVPFLANNSIVANAEWKSDNTGWWYFEGTSYTTG